MKQNTSTEYRRFTNYTPTKQSAASVRKPIGKDCVTPQKEKLMNRRLFTKDGRFIGNGYALSPETEELIKIKIDGKTLCQFMTYEEVISHFHLGEFKI